VPELNYTILRGELLVKARSKIHDTNAIFSKLGGSITLDPDSPAGAIAEITVDMRAFDAGDRLKNWKMKGDLDPDRWPTARFALNHLQDVREIEAGKFTALGFGTIAYRDHNVEIKVKGEASIDRRAISAKATFDLDMNLVGVTPPKILMLKVEDVVSISVTLSAAVAG
jgi:hypothetical protein